ncbi:MAG: T9SS type A sorting domain-containing protein, partial [Bacteroidales bacterium]|nr:T9SS type A sorting domain-containing protein [Bacteroidales bacterium]
YPNPAQEFLQVKSEDMANSDGEIIIVNALGMVMHRGSLSNGESRISLHGWASGVYTMLYRSQKGVQQVRFVKE